MVMKGICLDTLGGVWSGQFDEETARKWDSRRGEKTYDQITIEKALATRQTFKRS
jgi:hypothetical protein